MGNHLATHVTHPIFVTHRPIPCSAAWHLVLAEIEHPTLALLLVVLCIF